MSRNAGPESSTTGSLQGRDAAAAGGGVETGGSGLGTGGGVGADEAGGNSDGGADAEAVAGGLEEVDGEAAGDELVLLATDGVPHAAVRQAIATRTPIALPMPGERRTPARGYRAGNKKSPFPSRVTGRGTVG